MSHSSPPYPVSTQSPLLPMRLFPAPSSFFHFYFLLHREACRILVLQQGTEPGPSAVRVRSPNRWVAGEFLPSTLYSAAAGIFLMPLPYQSRLNIAIKIKIPPAAYKIPYALATAAASATLPHSCLPPVTVQGSSHSPSNVPRSLQPQGHLIYCQPYLIPDLYNLYLRLCRLHPELTQGMHQWMEG